MFTVDLSLFLVWFKLFWIVLFVYLVMFCDFLFRFALLFGDFRVRGIGFNVLLFKLGTLLLWLLRCCACYVVLFVYLFDLLELSGELMFFPDVV